MLANAYRLLLAFSCIVGLANCAGIRAWQATSYARSQGPQIASAVRRFLADNPVKYYFGLGPVMPNHVRRNAAMVRNGIVTVVHLSKRDFIPESNDALAIRLTSKGRALARKDHWNFVGAGPRGQFFTIRVGELRFGKVVSITSFLARVPWWSNRADPQHCFVVKYSASFVLTRAGLHLSRVNGGDGGPFFGGSEWVFTRSMSDTVAAAPRFRDAGKSVVEIATVCEDAKQGWRVLFPLPGVW